MSRAVPSTHSTKHLFDLFTLVHPCSPSCSPSSYPLTGLVHSVHHPDDLALSCEASLPDNRATQAAHSAPGGSSLRSHGVQSEQRRSEHMRVCPRHGELPLRHGEQASSPLRPVPSPSLVVVLTRRGCVATLTTSDVTGATPSMLDSETSPWFDGGMNQAPNRGPQEVPVSNPAPLLSALVDDLSPEPADLVACRRLLAHEIGFDEAGIDLQSANAVVTVYDALTDPINRQRYRRLIEADLLDAAEIAWKLVR